MIQQSSIWIMLMIFCEITGPGLKIYSKQSKHSQQFANVYLKILFENFGNRSGGEPN